MTARLLPSLLLLGLMVGTGASAWLRDARAAAIPERRTASAAAPWMADCLVGVGPKRRAEMAQHLRAGRWDLLPARARARAAQLFVDAPSSWAQHH